MQMQENKKGLQALLQTKSTELAVASVTAFDAGKELSAMSTRTDSAEFIAQANSYNVSENNRLEIVAEMKQILDHY